MVRRIARQLSMKIIEGPHVYDYASSRLCFAIIAESHISILVNKSHYLVWFDVTSCKTFDSDGLQALLRLELGQPITAPEVFERGIVDTSLPRLP